MRDEKTSKRKWCRTRRGREKERRNRGKNNGEDGREEG
jgi:hypothetical protein